MAKACRAQQVVWISSPLALITTLLTDYIGFSMPMGGVASAEWTEGGAWALL